MSDRKSSLGSPLFTQTPIPSNGTGVGKLKENMYLNQVPHNRYVHIYFYEMAADAVLDSVRPCQEGKIGNRLKIVAKFPELNPSMDSYRYVAF